MLSKDPYKGTRDFYPEDQYVQNHIFDTLRSVVESFGYQEYNAPILEETALYAAKTGEEIVNEQTYSFTDRGDRQVTIRPEMTPSFARMIANKRHELTFPARWYSIPNLWRYERPQRGRLREHWQLNVDIAGVSSIHAEVEIITMASDIMRGLGATTEEFEIRINSRQFLNSFFGEVLNLDEQAAYRLAKLLDKKAKMTPEAFEDQGRQIVGAPLFPLLLQCVSASSLEELCSYLPITFADNKGIQDLRDLISLLGEGGVTNALFDPTIMRGFDYYTGVVFEVYDKHPDNRRAMFGGGRYDGLVGIFNVDPVPCVGFGMGDVTAHDFLDVRGKLPAYTSNAQVYLCTAPGVDFVKVWHIAKELRQAGVGVAVELEERKMDKQIKTADKQAIPYVIVVGEEELQTGEVQLKKLTDGSTQKVSLMDLAKHFQSLKKS